MGDDERELSRRETRRAETFAEIKQLAFDQLSDNGPTGINLRAIARSMKMSSAAIFRYYPSRDDLIVALVVDAFRSLEEALDAAIDDDADSFDSLRAAIHEYRSWAQRHPGRFALLFTDPIPGFAAPADGPTSIAARSALDPFKRLFANLLGGTADIDALPFMMRSWGRWHGIVSLEIFHHYDWTGLDLDKLYTDEVEAILHDVESVTSRA